MIQCSGTRRGGEPCNAAALPGRALCWAHDPELRGKATEARRAGGENSSTAARAARRVPRDMADLVKRLLLAVDEVHRGELDPRRATAMAALGRAIVTVYEAGELQQRLTELEARVDKTPAKGRRHS